MRLAGIADALRFLHAIYLPAQWTTMYAATSLRGNVMNKIVVALAALIASATLVPAAKACDPEEAGGIEKCVRGARLPSIRQILPPSVRRPVDADEACDPEEVADVAKCLRNAKIPGIRQSKPKEDAADEPKEKKVVGKPDAVRRGPPAKADAAAPATVASSDTPAKLGGPEEPTCKKYFPSVGQTLSVPCGE